MLCSYIFFLLLFFSPHWRALGMDEGSQVTERSCQPCVGGWLQSSRLLLLDWESGQSASWAERLRWGRCGWGCWGTRSSEVTGGSLSAPRPCVWTCASSDKSPATITEGRGLTWAQTPFSLRWPVCVYSLRCMPGHTCYSCTPWRSWWRAPTDGSAVTPSPSRHGNSWDICRVCLCCVASGETVEETRRRVAEPCRPSPPRPLDRVTYLEVRQLGKRLFTARVGAFIRPVARVDSVREGLKSLKFLFLMNWTGLTEFKRKTRTEFTVEHV